MRYLPVIKHGVLENHPFRSMVISVTSIEFTDFPATFDVVRSWVRRERFGARGVYIPYNFPIQWGAIRSYLEFPNHGIVI